MQDKDMDQKIKGKLLELFNTAITDDDKKIICDPNIESSKEWPIFYQIIFKTLYWG